MSPYVALKMICKRYLMISLVKYFEAYGEVLLFYLPCFVHCLDVNESLTWCLIIPFRDFFGRKMISPSFANNFVFLNLNHLINH